MTCTPDFRHRNWLGIIGLGLAIAGLGLVLPGAGIAAPDKARGFIDKAEAALAKGDGIAGEAELRRAMEEGANRPDVAARMGEAMIVQSQLSKAREWLASGQFATGEEARGFRMLGRLELLEGHLSASGQAYDKALKFTDKDALLWVDIGRLRYTGGEQLQAVDAAERALAVDPGNVRALEFRAQLIRDQSGLQAALPWYERALEEAPDDLALLGGYAATLGELGRGGEMLVATRKMLELSPGEPLAYYLQAVLAARAGKIELARGLLSRTGDRFDGLPAAMLLQGILELGAGNANRAVEILDQLVSRQPANARAQALLARALYELGDYRQLIGRFGAAAKQADASAYLVALVGRSYEEIGDRAGAAPLLDRAAAAQVPQIMPIAEYYPPSVLAVGWRNAPGSAGAAVPYVRSLLIAGDMAGAERIAEQFRSAHPGSGDAQALAGDVQLALGRGGPALDRYGLASRIRFPEGLLERMVDALERLGRGGDSPALVSGYLSAYPASRLAARMAANHSAYAGDWERSRVLLENLRAKGGNRDFRLLADLSLAQLRTDDVTAAVESGARAYQLQRASPVAAQAYGMALVSAGQDQPIARQLLEKARKLGGDNPLLVESRAKLK
jgi:cellulose synthase operon protein C